MDTQQLIALIVSPVTASALVALLRRHIPKLDGPYLVPGVVVLLAVVGNVLPVLTGTITTAAILNAIVAGIVGGLTASGLVQIGQSAAGKASVTNNTISVVPSDPKLMNRADLERDTKPGDPPKEQT